MGSVRSSSTQNAALENRYEYDAFGKPYSGDFSSGMALGYTGKPYDQATGLYNYGYRDYAPVQARFTTVDPIRDGNNWLIYVNNDPINYIDPFGLDCVGSDSQAKVDALGTKPYRPLDEDIKKGIQKNGKAWDFVGDDPSVKHDYSEETIKRLADSPDNAVSAFSRNYRYLHSQSDPTAMQTERNIGGTEYRVKNKEAGETYVYAYDVNNDSWIDYWYEPRVEEKK